MPCEQRPVLVVFGSMNHSETELSILDYWQRHNVFRKSIDQRPEGEAYVFYDGPPFATGLPHYGHLLQSVTKDVVPRYFAMKGKRIERKWGWDCHGLPIEAIVEKELSLGSREDIERMGVGAFNEACDAKIGTYVEDWKKVITRLGRWVDMDNAYMTKDLSFMESVWWVFKRLYETGYIYEGYKIMHVSPKLETVLSNSEVSSCYMDITDISVYALFKITAGEHVGSRLVAWTTTPWTLPGNALLAVGENISYVNVKVDGVEGSVIVAKDLVAKALEGLSYEIEGEIRASELIGSTYEPLFPVFAEHKGAFRVVGADFVTTEEGTGVVHIAPGFGEDDMEVGKAEGVAPILHVKMNGRFVPELEAFFTNEGYEVEGWAVKNLEDHMHVDVEIVKWLARNGKLLRKQKIVHSYPHCWRTDVPLINYATSSWFVDIQKVKDKMLQTNQEIHWVPNHVKQGRFGKWLAGARDWSISRSRYWGTPLPIWRSEDGDVLVVGSVDELEALSGVRVNDLHKHVVDDVVIERDGKVYHRIPEVLDCWFESGAMPYAQLHYPFENERAFEHGFPAEFIAEAQDQTRGWFYTLHVLANALFGMPAFKNIVVTGLIMAEDGKKMSKRLQNYPDPTYVMEKYGSDALRYYLMSSPVVHMENLNFKEKDVDEVVKKFVTILKNVVSFYELYEERDDGRAPSGAHVLDAWMTARVNETLKEVTEFMDDYQLQEASRPLQQLVTDLSTWYVRRSRERVKGDGEDAKEALATLRVVLETIAKMIAPFMPFLAEEVYQRVQKVKGFEAYSGTEGALSVHLEDWPEAIGGAGGDLVLERMGEVRALVSRILDAREGAGRPVKQALGSVVLMTPSGVIEEDLLAVLLDEVNIKQAEVREGELAVVVDFALTPELVREGMARELTRRVNGLRKDAGLTVADRIELVVEASSGEVRRMLEEHGEAIARDVGATAWALGDAGECKWNVAFRVSEQDIAIGF